MKTKLILSIALLIAVTSFAQNNYMNYKAVVKDGSGNIVASQNIGVQIEILRESTVEYTETHTVMTDANGIMVLEIGSGTTTDDFESINWDRFYNRLSSTFYTNSLKVGVDIAGGTSYVDLDPTEFKTVPYAYNVINGGLFSKDDGWKLEDDFSLDGEIILTPGFWGIDMTRHGDGIQNVSGASGDYSFAAGHSNAATGNLSVAFGSENFVSGLGSMAIGKGNSAGESYSFVMGRYNIIAAGSPTSWIGTDPIFTIGNGTSFNSRSNAFTILKNGNMGIGDNTPSNPLTVFQATGSSGNTVHIESQNHTSGKDLLELVIPTGAPASSQFIEMQLGSTIVAAVNGDGSAKFKSVQFQDNTVQETSGPVAKGFLDITNSATGAVSVFGSTTLIATYNSAGAYIDVSLSGVSMTTSTYMVHVTPNRVNSSTATLDRSASVLYSAGKVRVYVWDASAGAAVANDCFISIYKL